ncbi:MAG: nitrogenase iron protein, partial [Dehalococcoidia bacterium]
YQMVNIAISARKGYELEKNCAVAGLINNMRGVKNEEAIVEAAGELMGLPVIAHIPRSKTVQEAEMQGKTVIEAFPNSEQAEVYRSLARRVLDNREVYVPRPITPDDLQPVILKYC